MQPVAIVGGGISGLSAAYYLSQAGLPCVLIEASSELGGVMRTERVDGCLIEAGPDSFISEKPWALDLIRELGLGDSVLGSNDEARQTYICRDGRLVALPDGIQFLAPTKILPMLTTSLFGWKTKLRMGLELLRRPSDQNTDRSVAQFVNEHYGREVNDYLAQPMLAGVYGGSSDRLSVNSVLPRFVEIERRYGSLSRGVLRGRKEMLRRRQSPASDGRPRSLFLSLAGGMQQLTDALASKLHGKVRRVTGMVRAVEGAAGAYRLVLDGENIPAAELILATPAYRAAELLAGLDPSLATLLNQIPYNSSITAALLYERSGFDHPLNGFGFLVPRVEQLPITACTWVNTKFPPRVAPNRVVLRGFLATEQAENLLSASDEELAQTVHQELSRLMGFRQQPVGWRVHRWERAMAQYEVGHQWRLDQIESRAAQLPGIHLAGNGYIGIGIPDCVRRSKLVTQQIIEGRKA